MSPLTLEDLRHIVDRAELLLQNASTDLPTYWNSEKSGFHANRDSIKSGSVNVTTTCFCLFAILPRLELASRFPLKSGHPSTTSLLLEVAQTLLSLPWQSEKLPENNIYTAPIAIRTLYKILEIPGPADLVRPHLTEPHNIKKLNDAIEAILRDTEQGAARFEPYEASAYLTYWSFRALRSEARHRLLAPHVTTRCAERAAQLASWAANEVYRQIASDAAHDAASFDSTQLAYALRIHAQNAREASRPLNQKLVATAIQIIAHHQMPDGLWPKSHPIFHYQTRGNVYTFTFELLDVLLSRALPANLFQPHVERLEASLRWAEENRIENETRGWRSNHLPFHPEPEAWSTAAVLIAVRKIRNVIALHVQDQILDHFRAQRFVRPDESSLTDDKFYDCEISAEHPSLRAVITKYLIRSHMNDAFKADRRYSAVFFGPPGTAKTTLAEAVARSLGWPYVYLQTSDFAGQGVNGVIGRARDVFRRLSLLERTVVLLDEVDEFVRDRSTEKQADSRMITTAMLSFIQELRRRESIIFIVATNFVAKLDAAITRAGGRFDLMLLVAPPSRSEKERMFRDRLRASKTFRDRTDQLGAEFAAFVAKHYTKTIQFFSFPEWNAFVKEIGRGMEEGARMSSSAELEECLERHHKVIAIRDQTDEYLRSRDFVRIS